MRKDTIIMLECRNILIETDEYTVYEDGYCKTKEPLLNVIYDLSLKLYNIRNKNNV